MFSSSESWTLRFVFLYSEFAHYGMTFSAIADQETFLRIFAKEVLIFQKLEFKGFPAKSTRCRRNLGLFL